jgi:hypothetical protein
MEEARRSPWEIYTPGSLEGKMNKQTFWLVTEREGEIHCTEILLTDDVVLMVETNGAAVLRNFHKPRDIVTLGEPLALAIDPRLFKLVFSISSRAGEVVTYHPLNGPDYKFYKAGEG